MVNENNAYGAIKRGAFPGVWRRVHLGGFPDYIVYLRARKMEFGRTFLVEVKELERRPKDPERVFDLELRPAQVPFFSRIGGWPGEKYVLVRWSDTLDWSWFSGKERKTSLKEEIVGPFKRG